MAHITLECPVCEEEFELSIDVTPGEPAQTYGPPENCYPGSGPEADLSDLPKECPECETVWTPEQKDELQVSAEGKLDKLLDNYEGEDSIYDGPDTERERDE